MSKEFRANQKIKNVITTSVNSEHFEGHGAIMKQEVADFFIENFTKKNDLVLDCFMGLGTTAISCIKNNRRYIGFEISKEYHKQCLDRIQNAKESGFQIDFFHYEKNLPPNLLNRK